MNNNEKLYMVQRNAEARTNYQYKIIQIAGEWRGRAIIDIMEELIGQNPDFYRFGTNHMMMFYSNVWDCLTNLGYSAEKMIDSLLEDLRHTNE